VHEVARCAQPPGARHVDGERRVEPARQAAEIAFGRRLTAGQHDQPRSRRQSLVDDVVSEASAGVARDYDVSALGRDASEVRLEQRDPPSQARPIAAEALGDSRSARRQLGVDGQRDG
jgi:hypothetical protein